MSILSSCNNKHKILFLSLGGPDRFCPPGAPAPLPASRGFYTSTTDTDACPPGLWRNASGVLDPSLANATNDQRAGWATTAAFGPTVAHLNNWGQGARTNQQL